MDESFWRKLSRQSGMGMWRKGNRGTKELRMNAFWMGEPGACVCVFPCHSNTSKTGLLNQMNSLGY